MLYWGKTEAGHYALKHLVALSWKVLQHSRVVDPRYKCNGLACGKIGWSVECRSSLQKVEIKELSRCYTYWDIWIKLFKISFSDEEVNCLLLKQDIIWQSTLTEKSAILTMYQIIVLKTKYVY